ncbi:30S ribosomal protein S4 [Mycoplasma iguanae]|uniref:Small ribosomal subunit protein uS4 n=1 Tax=Mycoplasma iguanae TaxID=292461 RepID=A0ABY5R9G2_9MOLU|nr:30S ribosomal protein S4 [Mycoplasma iguanae]UVD81620.1 30S ribosomal protein S4 [Mycoplasma iguanae]
MARFRGSTFKRTRRLGFSILETGKEFLKGKKREYAPGQHGQKKSKPSDYKLHMYEKQKVRYMYGLNERQFKNTFVKASKRKGLSGTNFLQMLEQRLDNVVYRAGFASTRRQARQLVNHGHFTLNGKKADIPSMLVSVGDVVELKEKTRKNVQVIEALALNRQHEWIEVKDFKATFKRLPERTEIAKEINDSLIVEYYNK